MVEYILNTSETLDLVSNTHNTTGSDAWHAHAFNDYLDIFLACFSVKPSSSLETPLLVMRSSIMSAISVNPVTWS